MAYAVWTLAFVAVCLGAEARGWDRIRRVAKLFASLGFIGLAVASGALEARVGPALLAALALSLVGDVCLSMPGAAWFRAGLGAFLLAHVAFAVAFILRGVHHPTVGLWVGLLFAVATVVWRWLGPHVPRRMRVPVLAYVTAISYMMATALETTRLVGGAAVAAGAAAFFLSDLFVARQRFVAPGPVNRWIGLPLYYAGQLLLARFVST